MKNGPSPEWLQRRLKAIGLRPISALVDITNYITFAYGRPLHVFDADKVKGNIRARLAKDGETIAALDGKTYTLTPDMTVIADDAGPEAIAGIIGGAHSGCSDATVNVFLEVGLLRCRCARPPPAASSASIPMRATASSAASIRPSRRSAPRSPRA